MWSYERLDDERRLLRRMSVFRGWVGLDDVAAVCGGEPDALHEMAALAEAIGATASPPSRRRRASSQPAGPAGLTERECAVVTLLARGMTNKEISRELHMSPKTVMHHTSSIYRKLEVRGREETTARAHLLGLTTPDHDPAGPNSRR